MQIVGAPRTRNVWLGSKPSSKPAKHRPKKLGSVHVFLLDGCQVPTKVAEGGFDHGTDVSAELALHRSAVASQTDGTDLDDRHIGGVAHAFPAGGLQIDDHIAH